MPFLGNEVLENCRFFFLLMKSYSYSISFIPAGNMNAPNIMTSQNTVVEKKKKIYLL